MTEPTITTEATPAPVAIAETKVDAVVTTQTPAPETTTTTPGNPEQGSAETKGKDGLPAGVKKRLWEQSEKIRKTEAELAELKKKFETPAAPAETVTDVNLLDDPEKWAKTVEGRILSNAEKQILSRIEQANTEKRVVAEAQKAQEFIFSRAEFGTADEPNEETRTEIQSIVASPEIQAVCAASGPMKGAEYALYLWDKSKGLDAASVKKANDNAAKSGAPTPSGVTAGKKTWTPAQVEAYLKDYHSPDYAKRKSEILQAQREGRIVS